MTQPPLLEFSKQVELAKQGDPQAIATLMNITLEPLGVTAKAFVEADCLHVFLSAARLLNAKTLVAFVQRGLLRLDVSSFQQVQVHGQRGNEPTWVETFVVTRSQAAAWEAPAHDLEAHDFEAHDSTPAVAPSLNQATRIETWIQQWLALKSHPASFLPAFLRRVTTAKQVMRLDGGDRSFQEAPIQEADPSLPRVNYLKLSVFVTLAAFLTGGAVALIANSYTLGGLERKAGKPAAIAAGSPTSVQSNAESSRDQQTAARNYLETMNKAQQAFYRQNKRFASTLEELERFAAAPIAVRSDYIYKLTVPSNTQAQLTAIPKASGLKSYTAAASIAKPTNRVVTAICASQQAATVPPLVFQSPEGAVQCPVEAAKAS